MRRLASGSKFLPSDRLYAQPATLPHLLSREKREKSQDKGSVGLGEYVAPLQSGLQGDGHGAILSPLSLSVDSSRTLTQQAFIRPCLFERPDFVLFALFI